MRSTRFILAARCREVIVLGSLILALALTSPTLAAPGGVPGPPGGGGGGDGNCTRPKDDLQITTDTVLCPGSYNLMDKGNDGILVIAADNIVLDGTGVTFDGKRKQGYGIVLSGRSNVTIQNFDNLTGYYYAIRAEQSADLSITGNGLSGNSGSDNTFLDLNQPINEAVGGGILFDAVSTSTVQNNVGTGQDVGINLYSSNGNQILGNDFSQNTAWGIRLEASDGNTLDGNQAHHVNRCNNSGCDSAGILLTDGSDSNTVTNNDITYSGDGFFIGNQFSTPSNNNLITGNDGSHSPNNCFEATFSENNVFRSNTANGCRYGFWLGFSHDGTTVDDNTVVGNSSDGIGWEHGHQGTITNNRIENSGRHGVWFDVDPTNTDFPHQVTSAFHTLTGNTITGSGQHGVHFENTTDCSLSGNLLDGNTRNLYFAGDSRANVASDNDILNGPVETITPVGDDQNAENNWWGTTDEAEIDGLVIDGNGHGLIDYDPWLTSPAL